MRAIHQSQETKERMKIRSDKNFAQASSIEPKVEPQALKYFYNKSHKSPSKKRRQKKKQSEPAQVERIFTSIEEQISARNDRLSSTVITGSVVSSEISVLSDGSAARAARALKMQSGFEFFCPPNKTSDSSSISRRKQDKKPNYFEAEAASKPVAQTVLVQPAAAVYKEGDLLFYRRAKEIIRYPPLEFISILPIKVKISGVHYDDFPNIYYTIDVCPREEQVYVTDNDNNLSFQERHADSNSLYALDHIFEDLKRREPPDSKKNRERQGSGLILTTGDLSRLYKKWEEEEEEEEETGEEGGEDVDDICDAGRVQTDQEPHCSAAGRPVARCHLPVQVQECETHFQITANAPGVVAADVQVTVKEGNSIIIHAFSHTLGVILQQQLRFHAESVSLMRSSVRLHEGILTVKVPKVYYFGSESFSYPLMH